MYYLISLLLVDNFQCLKSIKKIKPELGPVFDAHKDSNFREDWREATEIKVVHVGQGAIVPHAKLIFILIFYHLKESILVLVYRDWRSLLSPRFGNIKTVVKGC